MIRYSRLLILLIASNIVVSSTYAVSQWQVDYSESRLGFTATFEGAEFEGEFPRMQALIRFDPEHLAESQFEVRVDITAADTGSSDLNDGMTLPDWFDSQRFPSAKFVSSDIALDIENRYLATGILTVKGISRIVVLPFTWEHFGSNAVINGRTMLNRSDFRIGEGDWSNDDVIGLKVTIWTHLKLIPIPLDPNL